MGWKQLFQKSIDFFKSIRIDQSNENFGKAIVPVYTIQQETSVLIAMEKMVATRSHRIWVIDSLDHIIGLVSLSALMPLLLK
jgi:CBS domain containing-hemolysin-like protein